MSVAELTWTEETDVVVVGYGGAGAVAAISAHDSGASVLILERQPADTPTETRHTPSTRLSGGGCLSPTDTGKARLYLGEMAKAAGESLTLEREELIASFARALGENSEWMEKAGILVAGPQDLSAGAAKRGHTDEKGRYFYPHADYPQLTGSEGCGFFFPKPTERYRYGAAFFKYLTNAVEARGIPVLWETRGLHLVVESGDVRGIAACSRGKELAIKARRAVVLTCGGFEFNEWMKENYLRVSPIHFAGNPASTGDGVSMAMEVGAALWHMNDAAWRATLHFPDFPIAFLPQRSETASIFVDRRGARYTNEKVKHHAFGYELTGYDSYALCYPRVPSYWIFDEKRRSLCALAGDHGACNPPGGVGGDVFYEWSADNRREIDRGWIVQANSVEGLARAILADPDNGELMSLSTLRATMRRYNEYCDRGEDLDFHKPREWLQPIEDPPYYAVKLWPGGANTQGGPKRNSAGQVLRVDGNPVPRLYSAGELGSIFGMLYQGGGNLAECITSGRAAGARAAAENRWK
ncbi:MAG: FAD-binding protein [Chloroflexi bacterium]|nr:FAD-binding protein [Chloroflexota bacterium]